MNKFQILVVEDDPPIRNLIATTLKTHEYKYLLAKTERKPFYRLQAMLRMLFFSIWDFLILMALKLSKGLENGLICLLL